MAITFIIILGFNQLAAGQNDSKVHEKTDFEYIDLVHFRHTDIGYTDQPDLLLELHRRYIDIAIDAALTTRKDAVPFCWTAEALEPLYAWWQEADSKRKKDLLTVIKSGQFEVTAIPYGMSAMLGENEIEEIKNWIPDELWEKFDIKTAVQNDVNGITRAMVMQFLDNGGKYLWMGINPVCGGAPMKTPYGFWWKMPDGKKIFVWVSDIYTSGSLLLNGYKHRYMGQTKAANTSVWTPNPGDMLMAQEDFVRESHQRVLEKISKLKAEGYPFDFLIASFSNEWRCDNDPPFVAVTDFVEMWNKLGLRPKLNYTTIGQALTKAETRVGSKIPEYEGEWMDWWAFGLASMPRELASARKASRTVKAIHSPVWQKPLPPRSLESMKSINRDIVLFYEHTYGANSSISDPFGSHNLGQLYSIFKLPYQAEAYSEWILSQRFRSDIILQGKGLYVANTSPIDYTGWVDFDTRGFRGANIYSLVSADKGDKIPLEGGRFWIEKLPANSIVKFLPDSTETQINANKIPAVVQNQYGWPESVQWEGESPVSIQNLMSFVSVEIQNANTRSDINGLRKINDESLREKMRDEMVYENQAKISKRADINETPHSIIYTQHINHPRLENAIKEIELFNDRKLLRIKFQFDRISSPDPEVFFIRFNIPSNSTSPLSSLGGVNFSPYKDHLPGSNQDFMIIDEWVYYPEQEGGWLWTSDNVAMVTFGEHNVEKLRKNAPDNINELYAMVYNNKWYTNHSDNMIGKMEFEFYLQWVDKTNAAKLKDISFGLLNKPLVLINPDTKPDPHTFKYLYENK
jgi:hypothetical protein